MNKFLVLPLAVAMMACGGEKSDTGTVVDTAVELDMSTDNAKISYAMGAQQIDGMSRGDILKYLDMEAFHQGMVDAYNGDSLLVSIEEGSRIYMEKSMEPYQANKQQGENFLIENAKRPEVKTTNSGLQYEVLVEGNGPVPTIDNEVKTKYVGTFIDGTEFDKSDNHGGTVDFPVSRVIRGWTEALMMMPVGSKWKIYVPQDLAYGANPDPRSGIPPYSMLIFEMELVEIVK